MRNVKPFARHWFGYCTTKSLRGRPYKTAGIKGNLAPTRQYAAYTPVQKAFSSHAKLSKNLQWKGWGLRVASFPRKWAPEGLLLPYCFRNFTRACSKRGGIVQGFAPLSFGRVLFGGSRGGRSVEKLCRKSAARVAIDPDLNWYRRVGA